MTKITVTQLPEDTAAFESAFADLIQHTRRAGSELVLLPEMPFYPWVGYTDKVDLAQWQAAIDAHDEWVMRLDSLNVPIVLATHPVLVEGVPHNDAFIWQKGVGARFAHRKYYLPNEPGFWESTWYRPAASPNFQSVDTKGDTRLKIGFMICSDLWFGEHARGYARQGVHIVANPRATERASVDKWIAGGRAIAVMAGAYCISSNRVGLCPGGGFEFGGGGWVTDPDGKLLARTTDTEPFVTVEIDPAKAEAAKNTYPRNLKE